jgi:hypothetical protein
MIVRCKINYDVLGDISIISTSITPDKSYRVTEVDDIGFKIINDNVIKGQLLEKSKAKLIYKKAKERGKKAYLLSEESSNIFKIQR